MKGLVIGAGIILAIGIGLLLLTVYEGSREPREYLGIAFSDPDNNGDITMHIAVSIGAFNRDAPLRATSGTSASVPAWIKTKFVLTDSNGNPVTAWKNAHSKIISDREVLNPEFFVEFRGLRPGDWYTLDYRPFHMDPRTLRYEITCPDGRKKIERVLLSEP